MDKEASKVDSSRNFEVRELHEEYFVSDEDMEEEDDEEGEFESDTKRALEGYGEEKIEAWLSSFANYWAILGKPLVS
ncbi:hypothetical protein D8674_022112 [Pyrus ussuriensis x Pyrus communis]|uniref:Uncharacterized protein n=1 Tax=Pyrus ussuriensis x Pyrus communis TaxID=2448454 RepID=A0A5N5GXQ4_9ROSA|nr:hypothetical protein D8674_022112 [Pyrus ussuriensis x Pyrus communis]